MFRYSTWIGLVAFLLAISAPALADGPVYPVDVAVQNQVTMNNCASAEPVALNGNMHLEYSFTTDADGVNHFSVNVTNSLTGIGQNTRANYSASDSNPYSVETSQPSAELTVEFRSDLNPEGPSTGLTLIQTMHIAVDTNGNISGQVTQNNTQCGSGS